MKTRLIASALALALFCGGAWLAFHAPTQQRGYAYRGAGWWRYQIPPSKDDERAWATYVDPILTKADNAMAINGRSIVTEALTARRLDPDSERFRDALLRGN